MKKISLFLLLLATTTFSFAREVVKNTQVMAPDYLIKSQHQKKAALVLLSGGGLLAIAGFYLFVKDVTQETAVMFNNVVGVFDPNVTQVEHKISAVGPVLFFTGLASMLGSIPLFVASRHNKKRIPISAGLKIENGSMIRWATISKFQYPAVAIRISL
ncbi:MAG: hypothetical protein V4722_24090 [Bacteroidota bacterium]